ncbi:MAG: DUF167 domain-containing protein [Phycisphaerales bacterium]
MPYATEFHDPAGSSGVLLQVKAVPGSKRDQIAGVLGERLKVRVAAPPEGGKANAAICRLLAQEFGVRTNEVQVIRGHGSAEKTIRVVGIGLADATRW